MSDPKRATLITVDVPKSGKNNVNKTVRLTINLDESNESKYPELNYKELVNAEERMKQLNVQNGKTTGLDPFSDNDDDVEQVVRKMEKKYGNKSSYARKSRPKKDDFADIGAGYDENDSFIDNTDGYDEMIPPECDTLYGGFYINSGSLEFKMVPEKLDTGNKRRIESSSSEEESSVSCTSESQEGKDKSADTHTQHRKKKNKQNDKNKAKKIRRTDSSAATSGKQTSDENAAAGDGESVDSRTSHSDSLTSKPAPSSENALTSDSSRDTEAKSEVKLPPAVCEALQSIESSVERYSRDHPTAPDKLLLTHCEQLLLRLESTLKQCRATASISRACWARAAKALKTTRGKLYSSVKRSGDKGDTPMDTDDTPGDKMGQEREAASTTLPPAASPAKRKLEAIEDMPYDSLTDEQREERILDTLRRLSELIEERKPGMLANYNAECERVQEERKKLQLAAVSEGGTAAERRLPKRRFPWCSRSRALLASLARLAGDSGSAARLLAARALPLFPPGFVRMPTLLRQADLSKEIKASDVKRQRLGSITQSSVHNSHPLLLATTLPTTLPPTLPPTLPSLPEPIQFPSSLTVTTSLKSSPEKHEADDKKPKSLFGSIVKFSLGNEKSNDKEDLYVPPNNIGSITITPVPSSKDKKMDKPGLIRVKSPAALNEMVSKKDMKVIKKQEKAKDKVNVPLHVDTSFQTSKKDPSPKETVKKPSPKTKDEITQKQIETMRVAENNIPRPALVPVHHSPTFAKPDKRPPEIKKKKDLIVISDLDPLSTETLSVDDSSSDSVEVIEDRSDSVVPSKDSGSGRGKGGEVDESIETIMRNIREMANSQEPTKFTSNSYNGVITTAQSDLP